MKKDKATIRVLIMLTIVGIFISGSMVFARRGSSQRGSQGRGQQRGYHGRSHRGGRGGFGIGLGIGGGGIGFGIGGGGIEVGVGRGGAGFGFNPGYVGYWNRPYWSGWSGRYWGPSGLWLDYRSDWVDQQYRWPKITNNTGEAIKFYVSERQGSQYTLTVVTKSGETKTFPELELPDMKRVEVFMDNNGELQVAPM